MSSQQDSQSSSTKHKVDPNGKYYEVLGIENWQDASSEIIQKGFRKMAALYHPDRVVDDEEKKKDYETKFSKITEANSILKDPELKTKYDLILKQAEFKEKQKQEMDEKTKELRESLEEREKQAHQNRLKKENMDLVFANKELASRIKESGAYDALYKVQEKKQEREKKEKKDKKESGPTRQVIVSWKKSQEITEEKLKVLFTRLFGLIEIMIFKEAKRKCIISFESESSAQKAKEFDWDDLIQYKFKVKLAGGSSSSTTEENDTKKRAMSEATTIESDSEEESSKQDYDLNLRLMRMANKKHKIT
ncbi:predicted protein [Naegleria gruberi]|uniref:Predicted protein n=1 Tax=Naegleria gruberi TaxID=5762 RepID=D2V0C1_NAEGR|nr:uncharacterized protein NAEGRDRAFT_45663 [Naegleria gruberi]EFC49500.1 predicted protein [Naegleria gruberi]|eukprot:XP_002682244.1 predicted protein [Naegleria gruberi strain NEG-M]